MKNLRTSLCIVMLLGLTSVLAYPALIAAQEANTGYQIASAGEVDGKAVFGGGAFGDTVTEEEEKDAQICIMEVCINGDDILLISQSSAFKWLSPLFKWLLIIGLPVVTASRYLSKKISATYMLKFIPLGAIVFWIAANVRIVRKKADATNS